MPHYTALSSLIILPCFPRFASGLYSPLCHSSAMCVVHWRGLLLSRWLSSGLLRSAIGSPVSLRCSSVSYWVACSLCYWLASLWLDVSRPVRGAIGSLVSVLLLAYPHSVSRVSRPLSRGRRDNTVTFAKARQRWWRSPHHPV